MYSPKELSSSLEPLKKFWYIDAKKKKKGTKIKERIPQKPRHIFQFKCLFHFNYLIHFIQHVHELTWP